MTIALLSWYVYLYVAGVAAPFIWISLTLTRGMDAVPACGVAFVSSYAWPVLLIAWMMEAD